LEPDISHALMTETAQGRTALVIPLGFVLDHVEVLFDLDIKAKTTALAQGWGYLRAKTIGGHPLFIDMLVNLIENRGSLPTPVHRVPRVIVVGAGIAGLAAAHRWGELSARRGTAPKLTVVEAAPRPGGVIETHHRDGCLYESGPDSFITEKPAVLRLIERLGLSDQIIGTSRKHQRSFVVRDGKLHPTPDGFYLLAPSKLWPLWKTPLLSWWGKCRALGELFIPPRATAGDETLASFVRRRFGQELLDRLAQPMVAGIYSADPETLSLEATFPRFLELETRAGGVIRGLMKNRFSRKNKSAVPRGGTSGPRYSLFATLKTGLGALVDALVVRLGSKIFLLGTEIQSIQHQNKLWRVSLSTGSFLEGESLCLAVNAPTAARLLRPLDPELADLLEGISYGSVATLSVAFRRDQVTHPLNGFGFVVPALEKRAVTGCTFCHVKFTGRAPEGTVLLRAFIGGTVLDQDDPAVEDRALQDLQDLLGTQGTPLWTAFKRYPKAMPQYGLNHRQRLKKIEDRLRRWPGLALAGNGYQGIGLPDSIASGERAAETLFATAHGQPL
jgi:oxygen-dependent protoporphyrinogen oxidase